MISKEITSLQHPFIKHLVKLRTDRKYRNKEKQVLIAGCKLVREISPLKTVLVERGSAGFPDAEEIIFVTREILKKITGLENPEPMAAVVAMPIPEKLEGKKYLLVLDGIADPGNLGTLLRTALALSWEGAFLITGSADPFNDKALRAARGATFRLPLFSGSWDELNAFIAKEKAQVYIASTDGESIETLKKTAPPLLLVLGNEAHGASGDVKQRFPTLSIPMQTSVESLNVAIAGAILMYHLKPGLL
jgi:TrmH family RNA methyltransferase